MAVNSKTTIAFFLLMSIVQVFGQSNYASHANNINYIGNGLPEETVLDGKVSTIRIDKVIMWEVNCYYLFKTCLFFTITRCSYLAESIFQANCQGKNPKIFLRLTQHQAKKI